MNQQKLNELREIATSAASPEGGGYSAHRLENWMRNCDNDFIDAVNPTVVLDLLNMIEGLQNPVHCRNCDACGEEGCCSPDNCLYLDRYKGTYAKLLEEIERYRWALGSIIHASPQLMIRPDKHSLQVQIAMKALEDK